jgi:hypothetical protein
LTVEPNQGELNSWPWSRISGKNFLGRYSHAPVLFREMDLYCFIPDPVTNFDQPLHNTLTDAPELLSHAAARIISVARQCDLEHQLYAQTSKVHESQVRTLHTQTARRDATIAAF